MRSDGAGMQAFPAGAGKMTTRGRAPTGVQLGLDGLRAPGGQGYILSLALKAQCRHTGPPAPGLEPTLKAEFHVCYVASSPLPFFSSVIFINKLAVQTTATLGLAKHRSSGGVWIPAVLHKKSI